MKLFLVDNDPLHTLLVSQDGEPRYSIRSSADTPALSDSSHDRSYPGSSSSSSSSSSTSFSFSSRSDSHSSLSSFASAEHDHIKLDPSPSVSRTHSIPPHSKSHIHHIEPSSPHSSHVLPSHQIPSSPFRTTRINRLDRYTCLSRGNAETQVGQVEYLGDDSDPGIRVRLCNLNLELSAPAVKRRKRKSASESQTAVVPRTNDAGTALDAFRDFCLETHRERMKDASSSEPELEEPIPEPTWSFKGPDNRPYKWISLLSNPVLIHDTGTHPPLAPIACYRPAKLGIVSRSSRRGFLEIMPEGLEKEDWIVTTFVGYFRMRIGDRQIGKLANLDAPTRETAGKEVLKLPIGKMTGMVRMSSSAPATPASPDPSSSNPLRPLMAPSRSAIGKLPTTSVALASLEALRRNNKNYGLGSGANAPRRNPSTHGFLPTP